MTGARPGDVRPPARPTGGDARGPHRSGRWQRLGALAAAAGLAVAAVTVAASSSRASDARSVTGATLTWAINKTASSGASFGGCNVLSAGEAGDNGSSTVWTPTTPSPGYETRVGNVTVEKPDTGGVYHRPTWDTKCLGPDDTTALSTTSTSGSRVRITGGTGTLDPTDGTASIHWTGSFTSVFYGGLVYWTATDPTLTVHGDGTGTLAATLSGYGASQNDPTRWVRLGPTTIPVALATLTGIGLGDTGFTTTPAYRAVAVSTGPGDAAQVRTGPDWGSFPQDFIDFQDQIGESSYWYSSGLDDQAKVAAPITVGYTLGAPAPTRTDDSPSPSASTSPSTHPSPSPTAGAPTVRLDQPSLIAEATIAFNAAGFAPGETITTTVDSGLVILAPVVADSNGAAFGSDVLPASVTPGTHDLVLTGATSRAAARATFTVTVPASCNLANGVRGGDLTWGFKKSFRAYVAGGFPTNRITATGGATVLNQDLALAGTLASGIYRWPFVSSSGYTSADDFSVQYGGRVEFSYPAHFFDVIIANPKIVVSGGTGVMYANVSLTVTQPGKAPTTSVHTAEALATISLAGTSPVSDASGIRRVLHTAIADVASFSFDGTAFYTVGEALDDATVLLSGCSGTTSGASGGSGTTTTPPGGTGPGDDVGMIPALNERPDPGSPPSASPTPAPTVAAGAIDARAAGPLVPPHSSTRPQARTSDQSPTGWSGWLPWLIGGLLLASAGVLIVRAARRGHPRRSRASQEGNPA
jgi:hypothetical protein